MRKRELRSSAKEEGSGVLAKSAFPSEDLSHSQEDVCNISIYSGMLFSPGYASARDTCRAKGLLGWVGLPFCHSASNGTSGYFQYFTHYLSEPLFSCPCYTVGSSSPGAWQVRSGSHWNEIQNDPRKAQPRDNESTLCWQPLLQREMSMWISAPAISLSWWQPWPLLCLQAICFPGCWKAGKYQEALQKWCTPWPCLIIICCEVLSPKGRGCQQLWHSSCWLHMVAHRVAFGGHCFCWAVSWLSKELGDCRQQGSQISADSLLLH